jgi:hypothetical protein
VAGATQCDAAAPSARRRPAGEPAPAPAAIAPADPKEEDPRRQQRRGEPFGHHHPDGAPVFAADIQDDPHGDEEPYFHGLFPRRQLWQPRVPYPLWDRNWDGREPPPSGDREADRELQRQARRGGVTRHILLVRHGQYLEDEKVG